MHLHSFTYDYHLRCLYQFISERESNLPLGYHIVEFLDDFMKYYPKAPNYARSLVHTGKCCVTQISWKNVTPIIPRFFFFLYRIPECISVNDVSILPTQLFKYLLNHGENYNMDVFRMVPSSRLDEVPEVCRCFHFLLEFLSHLKVPIINFNIVLLFISPCRKMNTFWFVVKVYRLYVIKIQTIFNKLMILISLLLFLTSMTVLNELLVFKCIFWLRVKSEYF